MIRCPDCEEILEIRRDQEYRIVYYCCNCDVYWNEELTKKTTLWKDGFPVFDMTQEQAEALKKQQLYDPFPNCPSEGCDECPDIACPQRHEYDACEEGDCDGCDYYEQCFPETEEDKREYEKAQKIYDEQLEKEKVSPRDT